MGERERFEQVCPIPDNSDIKWYESKQQYLTAKQMWKVTAKGRTDAFAGWQARADLAAEQIAELEAERQEAIRLLWGWQESGLISDSKLAGDTDKWLAKIDAQRGEEG